MPLHHDPALALLAFFLLLLGAAPALAALAAGHAARRGAAPRPSPAWTAHGAALVPVAPVGAATAARIAEARGLAPVTRVEWRGGAWLVRAENGHGGTATAVVCPWSGRVAA